MTIIDKECWERSCVCYDERDGEEGVQVFEVVSNPPAPWVKIYCSNHPNYTTSPSPKHEWIGLTKTQFEKAVDGLEDLEDCWMAIEAKLKELNNG